jgi:quercetin dioxygenase-like cupin family protein
MSAQPIPPDDGRHVTLAEPDDPDLVHLTIGLQTYTILISGRDTGGDFALIDMLIPPGGGPPPHRHTFEEMFYPLSGAIEVTVRGQTLTAAAGHAVNVPALAPHAFRNAAPETARVLLLVTPAGLEDYFAEFGDVVPTRTSPPPSLTEDELAARRVKSAEVAHKYGIELL